MGTSDRSVVRTWEECEDIIRSIEQENAASITGVWFRGLASADWLLTTTLERRHSEPFFVGEYYELMRKIMPEVETLTGHTWDRAALEWSDPQMRFADYFAQSPAFSLMAHLRHHGFPSPLLDWSRSPYVAAYFAFARAQPEDGKNVAIFAYSETPDNFKSSTGRKPQICTHGGFGLRTHARHFRQQSSYTVCVQQVEPENPSLVLDSAWRFVQHQKVFGHQDPEQDKLYKIEIPSTERTKVLACLDRFNLNDFSLFGSEESLMESLAFRWIDQNK